MPFQRVGQTMPGVGEPIAGNMAISTPWYDFMQTLFNRTGGNDASGVGSVVPPVNLTPITTALAALQAGTASQNDQIATVQLQSAEAEMIALAVEDNSAVANFSALASQIASVQAAVAALPDPFIVAIYGADS